MSRWPDPPLAAASHPERRHSQKTEQRQECGTAALQRETTRLDLSISREATSLTHLARTEPVLYFPHQLNPPLPSCRPCFIQTPEPITKGWACYMGPTLAWDRQLSSSGRAVLQGCVPASFLECWLPLLPAWALSHFLLPLPCLSQTPLFGGQGGHGGARHPIS